MQAAVFNWGKNTAVQATVVNGDLSVGTHKKTQQQSFVPALWLWWIQVASAVGRWRAHKPCAPSGSVRPRCNVAVTKQLSPWLEQSVTSFHFPLGYHYNLSLYFGPSTSVHGISYLSWAHPEEAPLRTLAALAEWWRRWGKSWHYIAAQRQSLPRLV